MKNGGFEEKLRRLLVIKEETLRTIKISKESMLGEFLFVFTINLSVVMVYAMLGCLSY